MPGETMDQPETDEQVSQENSLEDRIAQKMSPSLMNDDQPEEVEAAASPEETESETATDFEEVEYEGEKFQVPPKLKEAIIRHADYTQKTQKLAETSRNIEYVQEQYKQVELNRQFNQSVNEEIQKLSELDGQIRQYKQLDWSSLSTDQAFRFKMELDKLKEEHGELEGKVRQKYQGFQYEQQKLQQELIQKGQEVLAKNIPGWNESVAKDVSEYAKSLGFTPQEISTITDPRQVQVLWAAMQHTKTKQQATQVAQKLPQMVKPGPSRPMPANVKADLNYRKALDRTKDPVARQRLVQERIAQKFFGG